ncbi:MAG: ATP-binding protein [Nocardioidaceae bacterium]|nr:ATP-binding protein [Nocardioidaceae bacterium]
MEVKIGVSNAARELSVDSEDSPDAVLDALTKAVTNDGLFILSDTKGRTIAVPADKIAYLTFADTTGRKVGFAK